MKLQLGYCVFCVLLWDPCVELGSRWGIKGGKPPHGMIVGVLCFCVLPWDPEKGDTHNLGKPSWSL